MDQYNGTSLFLQSFNFTGNLEDQVEISNEGNKVIVQTITGDLIEEAPVCKECNHVMHVSDHKSRTLKHVGLSHIRVDVEVHFKVYRCPVCGKTHRNEIPFKAKGHNMTWLFWNDMVAALEKDNSTLSNIASLKGTNRNIVRNVDKQRLEDLYGEMKLEKNPVFIGIDEFSLHPNHRYATVVVDLCQGHVIFIEEGNSTAQAEHFIQKMGPDVMKGVVGVAMDMNAQFSSAFKELCPWVKIVYDGFHIIKNYNETVLTEIRRKEQRRLVSELKQAKKDKDREKVEQLKLSCSVLKRSNFLILANRTTLQARDKAAVEHNSMLHETYEKNGLPIPGGERKWSTKGEEKLNEILKSNETLQAAYMFREQLQAALACNDPKLIREKLDRFIADIKASGIPELKRIWKMLEKRMDGIVSRAEYRISNGPVEGTNNMIKTLKRQAYGYRDTRYFFLKIWERSRRQNKGRNYSSPQKCA